MAAKKRTSTKKASSSTMKARPATGRSGTKRSPTSQIDNRLVWTLVIIFVLLSLLFLGMACWRYRM